MYSYMYGTRVQHVHSVTVKMKAHVHDDIHALYMYIYMHVNYSRVNYGSLLVNKYFALNFSFTVDYCIPGFRMRDWKQLSGNKQKREHVHIIRMLCMQFAIVRNAVRLIQVSFSFKSNNWGE